MTARHPSVHRSKEVFKKIELLLLNWRARLLQDARALEQEEKSSADSSGLSMHSAEIGNDRASHDVSLGCMESVTREIQEINGALDRMHSDAFGICDLCGAEISEKRLEAIPYARLCLSCKKAEESLGS